MNNLEIFEFKNNEVRVVDINGEFWFVLTDILKALNSTTTVSHTKSVLLDTFGDGVVNVIPVLDNLEREQKAVVINESATTFLISRSRTDLGKAMTKWIHQKVLPSIRKTGIYNTVPFKLSNDSQIVSFESDDYWVFSTTIAEIFGKEHKNVLRDLDNAIEDTLKFEPMLSNKLPKFKKLDSSYIDKYGRVKKAYKINRALFNYVVLGYQGDNAKMYRMMFIQAFEELEAKLKVFLAQQMIYDNPKRQQVYILKNKVSGLLKIGVTNDIKRRVREFENASGSEITVEYLSPKTDNAYNIEQRLHKVFAEDRGIGEWFDLPVEKAIEKLEHEELVVVPNNKLINAMLYR